MEYHGALVGWKHQELNGRILLSVETFAATKAGDKDNPDTIRVLMTKNQAGILAEYLAKASGYAESRPKRKGFFARYLG